MPRKQIPMPFPLVKLPDKLPGEDTINRGVDQVLTLMERDPFLHIINRLVEKIPIIPETAYSTPFGTYKTPEFYVPKVLPAALDDRKREAFKAAVLTDVASLIEKIPGLGAVAGPLSDSVEDTGYAKIHDTLTPEEDTFFKSYDKVDPLSTIAMIRTMVRTGKER